MASLSPTGASDPASDGAPISSRSAQKAPRWMIAGVAVIAVVVLVGAYVLTDGFHPAKKSGAEVLLSQDSYYDLPASQFAAVAFQAHSASTFAATFLCTGGITLYSMTPSELLYFSEKGQLNGYIWTSGRIANGTVDDLNLSFGSGSWDVVFFNADKPILINSALNTTIVSFFTDVTLSPT